MRACGKKPSFALRHERERKREVGARQQRAGMLGPLDEANCVGAETIGEPSGLPFGRVGEPIQINVIKVYARNWIMLNQSVARTLDRPSLPPRSKQAAHERRLAGAEIALQRDDHSARQHRRDRSARASRRIGIGQMALDVLQRLFRFQR